MQYIELGPVPAGEPCAQVGTDNYLAHSMRECEAFRRMLERIFPIPEGLPLKYVIRSHPHDFGTYREVSVRYNGDDRAACDFAFQVEAAIPEFWDAVAQQELEELQRRSAHAQASLAFAPVTQPAEREDLARVAQPTTADRHFGGRRSMAAA